MDANVYPFTPRPRAASGTPDAATRADVVPFVGSAVYTVREVSQYLRISLGGTYALIRSGEIPAMKLGGRWVIPKRRFASWLDSCMQEPAPDTADPTA
jgi:excisionase family DNA binding protein